MRTRRFIKATVPGLMALVAFAAVDPARAEGGTSRSPLFVREDFDARGMLRPGPGHTGSGAASFSFAQPGRLSMRQSYSLTAMSGGGGSMSSGLYLNTLSYQLSDPLSVTVDVGFHTPLHSSYPGLEAAGGAGSLVLPRLGLEYRPSERFSVHVDLFNGPDAWKAYGGLPWGSRALHGNRVP
jgi:hypothetical protein